MATPAPLSPEMGLADLRNAGPAARLRPLLSKKGFPRTTLRGDEACPRLEQEVRAVAKGRVARVLAAAKERRLVAFGGEHQGLDPRAAMRAVAEGLLLAPSATAPGITFAGLKLDLIRAELRSLWL